MAGPVIDGQAGATSAAVGASDRPERLPRGVWLAAAGIVAVLVVAGGGYGYHRDELYFQQAGRHPAFGYPDQPPLVPLLAAAVDALSGSLVVFRLLPALLIGIVVVLGALTARELGGSRADQTGTAVALTGCATVVGVGHLFSTTTFDLALTAGCVLLLVRAVAAPERLGRWLALGAVTGLALEVKTLPATVLACCGVGLVLAGPRSVLRRPGPWLAAAVALAGAAPDLVWQATHGWPQLELARAIAAGSSGTSVDRWLVVPLQLLLPGPVLAVPFVAGLVALLRAPDRRWLGVGYLALLAFVVATGGKPYYLLGLLPVLLAAGVPPVLAWLRVARWRRGLAGALLAVNAVVVAAIALPVVPVGSLASTPVVAVNADVGETVGWDAFTGTVATALAGLSPADRTGLVVLTRNYGEAGALDRARRGGAAVPPVYSGHNAYGLWGPPPGTSSPVLLVGYADTTLFSGCRLLARVDNGVGLDNEEQGASVRWCVAPASPWPALWPRIRRLG